MTDRNLGIAESGRKPVYESLRRCVTFLSWLLQYPRAVILGIGAAIAVALATYAREQSLSAVNWALRPITTLLPWNRTQPKPVPRTLSSSFTLVDLQLARSDGSLAYYRKTSAYTAHVLLPSYREGVAASGTAAAFRSARGRILETAHEHGFYMSKIDFGTSVKSGDEFVNVYQAELRNSFQESSEQWTQQISFPTEQLVIQVHFPADRPPISFQTHVVDGNDERPNPDGAEVVELYGRKSLVWNVDNPNPAFIYRLAWQW